MFNDDVKLLGPVHEKDATVDEDAARFKIVPGHKGLLLDAVGDVQVATLTAVVVGPGIMQPLASKMPVLLLLLKLFPDTFPIA